jgi:3-phytase
MIFKHALSTAGTLLLTVLSLPAAETIQVNEVFFTTDQTRENIDSPAVWHGSNGEHWLLATSKEGHSVNVFDASNGQMLQRIGGQGIELGQFNRPNGIWVIDNLAFVVERDNRRVQVLQLPDGTPVTSFGESELGKPYGLYVRPIEPGIYDVYVTDNYETPEGEVPADTKLDERVRLYRYEQEGPNGEGEYMHSFGDTSGDGRLYVVESIYGDPAHNRLLVAEELEDDTKGRRVKLYNLEGKFTGETLGGGAFKAQVEGIALYSTSETTGYWIVTDQSKLKNVFHLFDRESLQHLGAFEGRYTLNTDGVWVTNRGSHRYPAGLFYACDNDRAVSAFDMAEVLEALGLQTASDK